MKFKLMIGEKLNLSNPVTFNEKIQWLKLNDRKPIYTDLADKINVRNFIKNIIGEEYLILLLGVYNKYNDIDFCNLPNQFVIKLNHTSGNVFICRDKERINHKKLKKQIRS